MSTTTANHDNPIILPNTATWILNHYACPYCQTEWLEQWDCACNDRCSLCNKEIEPYNSEPLE